MKILYKALTTDGKWLKGLPRYDNTNAGAIVAFEEFRGPVYSNVYRDSIVPFVGITDKHGNEIFRGDIVKHYNALHLGNHTDFVKGEIFWDERQCCFKIRHSDEDTVFRYGSNEFYLSNDNCYEVIGNIYDDLACFDGCVSTEEVTHSPEIPPEIIELTEAINECFGCDAMYYGVDSLGIAGKVVEMGYKKGGDWEFPDEKALEKDALVLVMTTKDHVYINGIAETQKGCEGDIACYLPLIKILPTRKPRNNTENKSRDVEDMKDILDKAYQEKCKSCASCQYYQVASCREQMYAEALYDAGYRQQVTRCAAGEGE